MDAPVVARPLVETAVAARFFRGLGDPTRLAILELLLERERHVSEIVARLNAPRSRVGNHLACLRWCGYVETRREGTRIYYRVADHRLRRLLQFGHELASQHAPALASCPRITPHSEEGAEPCDRPRR